MNIEPIPKAIYDQLVAAGVTKLTLEFSGGNDEGYMNAATDADACVGSDLYDEIEEWTDEVYPYSGAGDGSDYGDNIVYDLKANTATHQSWYTSPTYEEPSRPEKFKVK
jgi:hypothetical protein